MPGPRVPWFPKGSKGGNEKGFYGPMPGFSLVHWVQVAGAQGPRDVPWDTPCPFYGMDQILVVERYIYF